MNKLVTIILFALLVSACNKNEHPKPDESGLYIKFFGGAFDDNGFSVAASDDGGFYLAGSTYDASRPDTNVLIIKVDQNGNKKWERSYALDIYGEVARDVIVDKNGDIVVAGYQKNKYGYDNFLILRISKSNPDNMEKFVFGDSLINERAYNLAQSSDGNYIIYGMTESVRQNVKASDMSLFKTTLTDIIWTRTIGVIGKNDFVGSMKIRSDGHLMWCGAVQRHDASNLRLVHADDYGNLIWDYGFEENDGINQFGYDMNILGDGGYLVAGSKNRTAAVNSVKDIYLVRTDADGDLYVGNTSPIIVSGATSQEAYSVFTTSDEIAVTGYVVTDKGDRNIYVARLDYNGNIIAFKSIGGPGDDVGRKISKTSDGYIVIGTITAANNTMVGIYKLNNDLELTK